MLKRIAAFLFIFAIAGQVYAGVCGCLNGESRKQHSCCKKQKFAGDSIKAKGCCDTECMVSQHEKLAADRTDPAAKIKFQALIAPPALTRIPIRQVTATASLPVQPLSELQRKYPHSPDLYLHHCAFLI